MDELATAGMSSKGQVVIPESVRKRLGLDAGHQFVVFGEDDVIILKRIDRPSMRDFDTMISKARKAAREAGMTKADVTKAVKRVRSRQR